MFIFIQESLSIFKVIEKLCLLMNSNEMHICNSLSSSDFVFQGQLSDVCWFELYIFSGKSTKICHDEKHTSPFNLAHFSPSAHSHDIHDESSEPYAYCKMNLELKFLFHKCPYFEA